MSGNDIAGVCAIGISEYERKVITLWTLYLADMFSLIPIRVRSREIPILSQLYQQNREIYLSLHQSFPPTIVIPGFSMPSLWNLIQRRLFCGFIAL